MTEPKPLYDVHDAVAGGMTDQEPATPTPKRFKRQVSGDCVGIGIAMNPSKLVPDFEAIRARLRGQHDAGLSWQELADAHGLTKGELYAFAVKGHMPRDRRILARLTGATAVAIVIQRRDGSGRFVKREARDG